MNRAVVFLSVTNGLVLAYRCSRPAASACRESRASNSRTITAPGRPDLRFHNAITRELKAKPPTAANKSATINVMLNW